jgi:hypothetical protein
VTQKNGEVFFFDWRKVRSFVRRGSSENNVPFVAKSWKRNKETIVNKKMRGYQPSSRFIEVLPKCNCKPPLQH